jgi:hypothetical protein
VWGFPVMRFIPMTAPAELHRHGVTGEGSDVRVAAGPLLIMAHGLMSIPPRERGRFWITSTHGELTPDQTEAALRAWQRGPRA